MAATKVPATQQKFTGFRAYRSAAQSVAGSSAITRINFEVEDYDTGGVYDNATNYRFTAPVNGTYAFSARTLMLATSQDCKIMLYKNGSLATSGNNIIGNYPGLVVSDNLQLVAGDYVDVRVANNAGVATSLEVGTGTTYFTGYLIGTA